MLREVCVAAFGRAEGHRDRRAKGSNGPTSSLLLLAIKPQRHVKHRHRAVYRMRVFRRATGLMLDNSTLFVLTDPHAPSRRALGASA